MNMAYLILVINPGSTSTKIALFENEQMLVEKTYRHDVIDLHQFSTIFDQKDFRKTFVIDFLRDNNISIEQIDVFVGRGGLIQPVSSGTFAINNKMIEELKMAKYGSHASNLGAIIAYELAIPLNKPAYIVDPVVVDELMPLARVSGLKGINRISIFHALNHKAVAKKYAFDHQIPYDKLNLIVAHLGGGISVGWHHFGKIVDVNNALGGEGPFSPERAGTLPLFSVVDLCFSGQYTKDELKRKMVSQGGLVSYLGTSSGLEIQKRIENNDQEAKHYFAAMAYQIAKQIGSLYFVAKGEIDAIIVTGGLAYNPVLISMLTEYLKKYPLVVYPGEDEMIALALGALRVLSGEEILNTY
ncbi:MAG: butyrate kinase [Bacilli bacterium]